MTIEISVMSNKYGIDETVHRHYSVYGRRLCSNVALPQMRAASFSEADMAFGFVTENDRFEFAADDVVAESRHETNVDCDLVVIAFKEHILLRFEGKCDFLVKRTGKSVVCFADRTTSADWIRSIYYGMVMAFCLHLAGKGNLHASAFVTGTGVIGLMAAAGSGKSTLSATFGARGFPLLTDDVLAIDELAGEYLANPGLPHVSLSDASMTGVFGTNGSRPRGDLSGDKMRVRVDGDWATSEPGVSSIRGLFVISRTPNEGEIVIDRTSEVEATRIIAENSLCLEFLPQEELKRHLAFASRVARSVPVYRLSYPSGFDHITAVQDAILGVSE